MKSQPPSRLGVEAGLSRRLGRAAEPVHGVVYYTPEITAFDHDGFRGWWHAYFAHRSAPLGRVGPELVTSIFYNFAFRMVARALPGAWDIMAPEQVLARRAELVGEAMGRIYGDGANDETIEQAAALAKEALAPMEVAGRPLAASVLAQPWPASPAMSLWHACTALRELRGDAHILALAAAGIGPVQSHILMAAHGRVNQPTIAAIRGWTEKEWRAGVGELADRGLVDAGGTYTDEGRAHRAEIERRTDRLSDQPVRNLGPEKAARLADLLETLGGGLIADGEVAGVWPPPAVRRR